MSKSLGTRVQLLGERGRGGRDGHSLRLLHRMLSHGIVSRTYLSVSYKATSTLHTPIHSTQSNNHRVVIPYPLNITQQPPTCACPQRVFSPVFASQLSLASSLRKVTPVHRVLPTTDPAQEPPTNATPTSPPSCAIRSPRSPPIPVSQHTVAETPAVLSRVGK